MRARFTAAAALTAGVVLGLTGCGFVTPLATTDPYDPSDGTSVTVGDVRVLNALIISEDGEDGNLVASVVNDSDSRASIKVQYDGADGETSKTISVAGGETSSVGTDETFLLEGIDSAPGSLVTLFIQQGNDPGKELTVPVLDTSLDEYSDLAP